MKTPGPGASSRRRKRLRRTGAEPRRRATEAETLRSSGEPRKPGSLHHEISVYQEELIIQNESLIAAQTALEETRDRFIELYDFAPNGYLTVDRNGVVRECNLTAAAMIGKSKPALEGMTLLALVHRDDRSSMIAFLQRCRAGGEPQVEAEFLMRTANGVRHYQLLCRGRDRKNPPSEFFVSMLDVTERRQLDRERMLLAEERAALAGRLLGAEEQERTRIARNLHDDLGQQVTALRLMLEHVLMESGGDARARLLKLRESIARVDESLHVVSMGLRPVALELGIVPAVRQLLDDWTASSGVAASLQTDDFPEGWLTPEVESQLFRILQEALTNVAKHAGAEHVGVALKRLDSGASLTVDDDGRGITPDAVRSGRYPLGVVGMRERAQLVGGRIDIRRGADRGTVMSLTVPRGIAGA